MRDVEGAVATPVTARRPARRYQSNNAVPGHGQKRRGQQPTKPARTGHRPRWPRSLPAPGKQIVQHAVLHITDQIGELGQAQLDPLAEIVGDHHAPLLRSIMVQPQLRATAGALAAECGDPLNAAHDYRLRAGASTPTMRHNAPVR